MMRELKESGLALLVLLTTSSTLVCCTIPVLLILLGLGSALTTLTMHFGWWIALSEYKFWLFLLSAVLILFCHWLVYSRKRTCPVDPKLAQYCEKFMKWNRIMLKIAIGFWVVGFISAYLLAPVYEWF